MFKSRFVSRRALLADAGKLTLSAGAIALLAGNDALANTAGADASKDTGILNIALALEHEAIAAYQIGAESGLLAKEVLPVAVLFQSHHKAHRDALADTVRKLGGTPAAEQAMDAYVKSSKLNVAAIKSQGDVLALAQRLELGAANAYLGVIPAFGDRELAKIAGRLAADETMHYTALTQALGGKLPSGALSFGG
ncbi:MAG TPA: ferritin-like domain-containing protein [Steroidobacteraceae bacterium]|jgi:ferritin-like protein|nr:ferritin-like domain-containing protein [Steroidobacteraceae bacterium]